MNFNYDMGEIKHKIRDIYGFGRFENIPLEEQETKDLTLVKSYQSALLGDNSHSFGISTRSGLAHYKGKELKSEDQHLS